MSDIPKVLYHYCSLESFRQIMTNKSIWLSDISKSNDSEELIWIKQQAKEHFMQQLKDLQCNNPNSKQIKKINYIIDSIDDDHTVVWAMCFSEKRDDLGQWRGYADDGKGISIGFDSDVLKKLVEHLKITHGFFSKEDDDKVYEYSAGIEPINYCSADFFAMLDHYFDNESTATLKKLRNDASTDNSLRNLIESYFNDNWLFPVFHIQAKQHLFKNPSFSEEAEWRLYITGDSNMLRESLLPIVESEKINECGGIEIGTQKFGFIVKNNTLVSHIEQFLPNIQDMISEIIIGPKCNMTEKDLDIFLSANMLIKSDEKISISKSVSSYR